MCEVRWQTQPEKICKLLSTNQYNMRSEWHWFVRCDLQIFSGCVCHLEQLHAQSPFLFPIVFSINPLWGHCQEYKIEKKSNPTRASFIRKKKRFCLLQPYLVWKFLSHWSRKTSPKVRGTLKSLPKVVSKRSRQEECVQIAKTAKSVASCVASQVLQVPHKLPSFPRKAEFSQIER